MKYYLAYGSNLNKRQMLHRCPAAAAVGACILQDYRLAFRFYATVEPASGESVQCGLWKITERDEAALDRYEGFPKFYRKETVTVTVNGKAYGAMVYIMNESARPYCPPSSSYLYTIAEGYDDFGLDTKPLSLAAV